MKQKLLLGAFAAFVFLPNFFPVLPPIVFWLPILLFISLLSFFLRKHWFLPLIAGLSYGLYAAGDYSDQMLLVEQDADVFSIVASVTEADSRENGSQRLELDVENVWTYEQEKLAPHPKRLLLSWYGEERLSIGSRIHVEAKLRRPRGLQNPGLFDYQKWLVAEGFGATGYIREVFEIELASTNHSWLSRWRDGRQTFIAEQEQLGFPGIHQALSLGEGSAIAQESWELFRDTGTVHLMVISGLHVGLMAALGYFFGFAAGRFLSAILGFNAVRIAIISSLSLAFVYSALSGFGLPAIRAMIMLICLLIPRYLYLNVSPWWCLSAALAAVSLVEPRAVLQTGFWLSFGAVALLLLAFIGNGKQQFFVALLRTQLLFFICFSGVLIWQGLPAPMVSIVANMVAVPLISLVIAPLEVLALFISLMSKGIAIEIWMLCDRLIAWLIIFLEWLVRLDLPPLVRPGNWSWVHGLAVLGAFLIFVLPGMRLRLALAMSWIPFLFVVPESDYLLKLRVFDVGQGTAVLVQQPGYSLLYDTGPRFSESFDAGADIIVPTLQQKGVTNLDHLIVSHPDGDHRGGLEGVLDQLSVEQLHVGKRLELDMFKQQSLCRQGSSWNIEEVEYRYLWPDSDKPYSNNDSSCVLVVESDDLRILIPGDISSTIERELLQQREFFENADLLIAPHHGSSSSSSRIFLNAVSPNWAVVSAGYQNQFNHPHPDVVGRYESAGSHVLNTASSGAIEFYWDSAEKPPRVTRATESKIFWWQK